jgi:hypothetical protein
MVKHSNNIKEALQDNLIKNKVSFQDACIQFIEENKSSFARLAFTHISTLNKGFKIDINLAKENISKSIQERENFTLKDRLNGRANYRDNEIFVNSDFIPTPEWNSQEHMEGLIRRQDFEYICEQEFWEDEISNSEFGNLSDFNCFNDLIIAKDQLTTFQNRNFNNNVEGWDKYIQSLIQINFLDFFPNMIERNGKLIFYSHLGENLNFGFFYDRKKLITELRQNILLPDYLNLFILNGDVEKLNLKSNPETYMSLGILGNPFFFHPCFPLLSFSSIDMFYRKNEMNNLELNYKREFIELANGNSQVMHPQEYGEKLKMHACFYLKLLRMTSQSYLDFLRNSVSGYMKRPYSGEL